MSLGTAEILRRNEKQRLCNNFFFGGGGGRRRGKANKVHCGNVEVANRAKVGVSGRGWI